MLIEVVMRKFHFNLYMITSLFVKELDDLEMMGGVFQTPYQVMKFSTTSQVITTRKIRSDWATHAQSASPSQGLSKLISLQA